MSIGPIFPRSVARWRLKSDQDNMGIGTPCMSGKLPEKPSAVRSRRGVHAGGVVTLRTFVSLQQAWAARRLLKKSLLVIASQSI